MRTRRTLRFSLLAVLGAAVLPAAAAAHANLVQTVPAAGAVLARSPGTVRLVFDDVVQPAGGTEAVANATGKTVLVGRPQLAPGHKTLVLRLRARLPDGDYSVRWRVLSDDGHFIAGTLAFAVGAGRAPPQSVLAAAGGTSARDLVARWLLFAGLLLAAGAASFRLLVVGPALRRLEAAARDATEHIVRVRLAALVLAGSLLFLAGASTFLQRAGWQTRFGATLRAGLIVAGILAAAAALAAVHRRMAAAASWLALLLLPVPSVAGHALDAGVPWPNVPLDVVHVAAAAVWTGGLAALALALPAAALTGGPGFARAVVARLSALALAAVVVLAATGAFRAVYELRTFDQLWTTGYGRALLVKTGLLLVLTGTGWANRRRLGDRGRVLATVRVELVLLAGLVVAVAFLTQLRPGRDAPRTIAAAPVDAQPFARPPAPPRGALVLARQSGRYAVALAVTRSAATVTVLDPSGGGADGLAVTVGGRAASACGHGCYAAPAVPGPRAVVAVAGRTTTFEVPRGARPAAQLLARATRAFRSLRSVSYEERLSSGTGAPLDTRWRLEAPDRAGYRIAGGPEGVLVGARRWDRDAPGKPWQRSDVTPLEEPAPIWGTTATNVELLREDARTVVLAWVNPEIPAFFVARFDRRTLLPRTLEMTAAAHFMHHDYLAFDRPLTIRPPAR